jgi:hypothetical protein
MIHIDEADRGAFAFGPLPSRLPWHRLLCR